MQVAEKIELLQSDYKDPISETPTTYPAYFKLIQLGFRTLGSLAPKQAARVAYQLFSTPRSRARHRRSDEVLESARIFEFLYGEHLLKGYEWGSGTQTVLLVHGWESRGTALRSFVPQLVESGYRVVAFDGPAHGDSEGQQTNLAHFGGAVRAIIRQLGNVHGIITHSFGGASTVYALGAIDSSIAIEKLVLIAVPSSMTKVWEDTAQLFRLPAKAKSEMKSLLEKKVQQPLENVSVSDAESAVQINETLIVHDKTDHVVPFAEAEKIVNGWESARLLASNGYGHFRLMKNPDIIQRVVDFVAD